MQEIAYVSPVASIEDRRMTDSPIITFIVLIVVLLAISAILAVAVVVWCWTHGQRPLIQWGRNDTWSVFIQCG